jgi:two-component system, LuxR family, response regulator FixJ
MTADERTVFVVDDDDAVREGIAFLLDSAGFRVTAFASAGDFLAAHADGRRGCLVLDVRMPHMTGLELQQELNARRSRLPTIFITGHGTVTTAIAALRAGAFDFIEKPVRDDILIDSVRRALDWEETTRELADRHATIAARHRSLTDREREVMALVVEGAPNKVIAHRLGVAVKTIEVHRARVMEKMEARTLSALVRMALALENGQD